ncbi:hypothetical protein DFJ74DRAFT_754620 [Hyaloraphidium curvatum]|nr:hypothetical protein DFJ74DRAFT_754620 [Hyaloraphidium curvatum]
MERLSGLTAAAVAARTGSHYASRAPTLLRSGGGRWEFTVPGQSTGSSYAVVVEKGASPGAFRATCSCPDAAGRAPTGMLCKHAVRCASELVDPEAGGVARAPDAVPARPAKRRRVGSVSLADDQEDEEDDEEKDGESGEDEDASEDGDEASEDGDDDPEAEIGDWDDFGGDCTRPAYVTELRDVLSRSESAAAFASDVPVPDTNPYLSVAGFGVVPLPLIPLVADALKPHLEPSKFGRGAKTLLDKSVRNSLEAPPDKLAVGNSEWDPAIQRAARLLADHLGVSATVDVETQLWRLVLYEPGSFFTAHRDSEKAPGMFATLVLQLPCSEPQRGGALVVSHGSSTKKFAPAGDGAQGGRAGFGFFADCAHEVERLDSGRRLVLIYNVVRRGTGAVPSLRGDASHDAAVARIARCARLAAQFGTRYLLYPLEHSYTPASLAHSGASAFKGRDAAAWRLLSDPDSGFAVGAAEIELKASGQGDGYYDRRYGSSEASMDWHPDDGGEIDLSRGAMLHAALKGVAPAVLLEPGGAPLPAFGTMQMVGSDTDFFRSRDRPKDRHAHYTGNASVDVEYQYRTMALVLFPDDAGSTIAACSSAPGKLTEHALRAWRVAPTGSQAKLDGLELLQRAVGAGATSARGDVALETLRALPEQVSKGPIEEHLKLAPAGTALVIAGDKKLLGLVGWQRAVACVSARDMRTDPAGELDLLLKLKELDPTPSSIKTAKERERLGAGIVGAISSATHPRILGQIAVKAKASGVAGGAGIAAACTALSRMPLRWAGGAEGELPVSFVAVASLAEGEDELGKVASTLVAAQRPELLTGCRSLREAFAQCGIWESKIRPALLKLCPGSGTRGAGGPPSGMAFRELLDACADDSDAGSFAVEACAIWVSHDRQEAFKALRWGSWWAVALADSLESLLRGTGLDLAVAEWTVSCMSTAPGADLAPLGRAIMALEAQFPRPGPEPKGWPHLHGLGRTAGGLPGPVAAFLGDDAAGATKTFVFRRKMDRDPVARLLKQIAPSVQAMESREGTAEWKLRLTKTHAAHDAAVAKRKRWEATANAVRRLGGLPDGTVKK